MNVSEDGQLVDVHDPDTIRRIALATLSCPIAYCIVGDATSISVATRELEHCAATLGHTVEPQATLRDNLDEELGMAQVGQHVAAILIPRELPETALSTWGASRVCVRQFDAPEPTSVLTYAIAPSPVNERGAAIDLRVTGDADVGLAERWATAHGAEVAVRTNLRGSLARVHAWSVAVNSPDGPITPPIRDGAPFDLWRDALLRTGTLRERTVAAETLERGAAAITGWGAVHALTTSDAEMVATSAALADELNQAISRLVI